jgi:hypothetical protein
MQALVSFPKGTCQEMWRNPDAAGLCLVAFVQLLLWTTRLETDPEVKMTVAYG